MRITVIIPTYNEAENLPKLVSALLSLPLDIRILVVDDNSPDGTGDLADKLAQTYPEKIEVLHRPGKMGLRSAYLNGFQKIFKDGSQAIVQMDADFSHDPIVLIQMAKLLETKDIVIGSRYVLGGSVDDKWPIWRKWLSAFGNFYARTILALPFHDVTTGYRMWRSETLKQMPFERIQSTGYIFLVEMIYLANCLEFKIGETPIYFADRRFGKSKMSFRIQMEAAMRIWYVLWNYRDLRKAGRWARV
ncbi:MAG: polyprenol monophosphomannose synthase [Anaerolineales bacterium]|nr:polyprenol monophosphomannose synthase [Anaerolineales bacterium]MCB9144130.1 polyprenol monophosphomannose synthase [Anaerolineales bacterium]